MRLHPEFTDTHQALRLEPTIRHPGLRRQRPRQVPLSLQESNRLEENVEGLGTLRGPTREESRRRQTPCHSQEAILSPISLAGRLHCARNVRYDRSKPAVRLLVVSTFMPVQRGALFWDR